MYKYGFPSFGVQLLPREEAKKVFVLPTDLMNSADRFIRRNYEDVAKTENFQHMTFEELDTLLSSEMVFVSSEDILLGSILSWSSVDEERCIYVNRKYNAIPMKERHLKLSGVPLTLKKVRVRVRNANLTFCRGGHLMS